MNARRVCRECGERYPVAVRDCPDCGCPAPADREATPFDFEWSSWQVVAVGDSRSGWDRLETKW